MCTHNIIVTNVLSVLTFPERGVRAQYYSDKCVISVDFSDAGCTNTSVTMFSFSWTCA